MISWFQENSHFSQEMKIMTNFSKYGKIVKKLETGFCSDTYVMDQGECTIPRYICIKIPKSRHPEGREKAIKEFVDELNFQTRMVFHPCVHYFFDLGHFFDVPYAMFRFWDGDLLQLIKRNSSSMQEKISIIVYIILGLEHCHKRGMVCHRDLKPSNIFIRDFRKSHRIGNNLDIYKYALIADFGLAVDKSECENKHGSKPYMAPEQWLQHPLSEKTDVFALGVIAFEFFNEGFHPIGGVKTDDWWPQPRNGNSKKYCDDEEWKKWVKKEVPIYKDNIQSNPINEFIFSMLNFCPDKRPSLSECKVFFLKMLECESALAKENVNLMINSNIKNWTSGSPNQKENWPYLNKRIVSLNKWMDEEKYKVALNAAGVGT